MSPDVAIISATVAVAALVLAIFSASWLNQRNIERLLEQMEKRFDARFESVLAEIRALSQRPDRIERQLDAAFRPTVPPRA